MNEDWGGDDDFGSLAAAAAVAAAAAAEAAAAAAAAVSHLPARGVAWALLHEELQLHEVQLYRQQHRTARTPGSKRAPLPRRFMTVMVVVVVLSSLQHRLLSCLYNLHLRT